MNLHKRIILFMTAVIVMISSCNKESIEHHTTLFLGHRGNGADGYYKKNAEFPHENTLEAIKQGFKNLDGAEIDIQMSADSIIWVWHDDIFTFGSDSVPLSIPMLRKNEIYKKISNNNNTPDVPQLEEVFELLSQQSEIKSLSLDVKGYFPYYPNMNTDNYLIIEAEQLTRLIKKYKLTEQVMVETDYMTFLDRMKILAPEVNCYLLGYTDLREKIIRAAKKGYDGISFNAYDTSLTTGNIRFLEKKNQKIQLWTVNDTTKLKSLLKFHPVTIQTDNIDAGRIIRTKFR